MSTKILQALAILTILSTSLQSPPPNYALKFSDNFTSETLNTSKWDIITGQPEDSINNGQKQTFTNSSENIYVSNAELHIRAAKNNGSYTSARIHGKFPFTYGYVEARIKLPQSDGVWPVFGLLGQEFGRKPWPQCGAISVAESWNTDENVHGVCRWDHNGTEDTAMGNSTDFELGDYHTYALHWTEEYIEAYVNDTLYFSMPIKGGINHTEVFHKPFFLRLDVGLGGDYVYDIDDSELPQELVVDYIRVYQPEKPTEPKEIENEVSFNQLPQDGCSILDMRYYVKLNSTVNIKTDDSLEVDFKSEEYTLHCVIPKGGVAIAEGIDCHIDITDEPIKKGTYTFKLVGDKASASLNVTKEITVDVYEKCPSDEDLKKIKLLKKEDYFQFQSTRKSSFIPEFYADKKETENTENSEKKYTMTNIVIIKINKQVNILSHDRFKASYILRTRRLQAETQTGECEVDKTYLISIPFSDDAYAKLSCSLETDTKNGDYKIDEFYAENPGDSNINMDYVKDVVINDALPSMEQFDADLKDLFTSLLKGDFKLRTEKGIEEPKYADKNSRKVSFKVQFACAANDAATCKTISEKYHHFSAKSFGDLNGSCEMNNNLLAVCASDDYQLFVLKRGKFDLVPQDSKNEVAHPVLDYAPIAALKINKEKISPFDGGDESEGKKDEIPAGKNEVKKDDKKYKTLFYIFIGVCAALVVAIIVVVLCRCAKKKNKKGKHYCIYSTNPEEIVARYKTDENQGNDTDSERKFNEGQKSLDNQL